MESRFTDMPERIARLPVDHRGFPVPWFVAWIDGKPDHRVADTRKLLPAVKQNLCWICGDKLGRHLAFTLGPMCAITRCSGEPPAHRDCAIFAATHCPFLSIPEKRRREKAMSEKSQFSEFGLKQNPGCALVWITNGYRTIRDPSTSSIVCQFDDATEMLWFCEGRPAVREEVVESIRSGLPMVREVAKRDGPEAERLLASRTSQILAHITQTVPHGTEVSPCEN